jgi:ATP phosphoribosyltransferase
MEIDLQQIENILTKAKQATTNEADRLDIEIFLEQLSEINLVTPEAEKPQKAKLLLKDVAVWIETGKAVAELILLWMHHK